MKRVVVPTGVAIVNNGMFGLAALHDRLKPYTQRRTNMLVGFAPNIKILSL
ncbi:MAG: hypothetical protein WAM70_09965 [Pyrinomonadaceae bacterium]